MFVRFWWYAKDGERQEEDVPYSWPGLVRPGDTVTVRDEKRKVRSVVNSLNFEGWKVLAGLEDTRATADPGPGDHKTASDIAGERAKGP